MTEPTPAAPAAPAPATPAPATDGVRAAPTAVAVSKRDELEAKAVDMRARLNADVAARRERNAMVAQIRGTQWGLGADSRTTMAVANYCLQMRLDPVRHVEVLGGRIYLTATLYEERAAPLIRAGVLIPHEVEFINVDERLDVLAKDDDPETAAWAKKEKRRRAMARITYNAPDKAMAIAVKRITIAKTGKTIVGVNWCGGGTRKKWSKGTLIDADPVGDLEPTKTAETRAGRRAWKQVADIMPAFGEEIAPLEAAAAELNAEAKRLNAGDDTAPRFSGSIIQNPPSDPYGIAPATERAPHPGGEAIAEIIAEPDDEQGTTRLESSLEVISGDAYAGEQPPEPTAATRTLVDTMPMQLVGVINRVAEGIATDDDREALRQWKMDRPDLFPVDGPTE